MSILRCWAAILVMPFAFVPANALTIEASLNGFDTSETRVFDAVFDYWETTILDPFTVGIAFSKASLAGDLLGLTSNFATGAGGLPAGATVQIDNRVGSAFGWFVDPTPAANEEFVSTADPSYFAGKRPGPAGQDYDLLSILHHEMTHILGFSTFYPRFASKVGPSDFGVPRVYQGSSFATLLTGASDGTHLFDTPLDDSYLFHHPDLMMAFQSRGERVLPSALDLAILSDAFGYDVDAPDTAVPEPGPFSLLGASLCVLGLYRCCLASRSSSVRLRSTPQR
jgi:hypothetical protein